MMGDRCENALFLFPLFFKTHSMQDMQNVSAPCRSSALQIHCPPDRFLSLNPTICIHKAYQCPSYLRRSGILILGGSLDCVPFRFNCLGHLEQSLRILPCVSRGSVILDTSSRLTGQLLSIQLCLYNTGAVVREIAIANLTHVSFKLMKDAWDLRQVHTAEFPYLCP
jgi:hypothetical protein